MNTMNSKYLFLLGSRRILPIPTEPPAIIRQIPQSYLETIVPLLQEGHNQQLACLLVVVPIQLEDYKEVILEIASPVEAHSKMLPHLYMVTEPIYWTIDLVFTRANTRDAYF